MRIMLTGAAGMLGKAILRRAKERYPEFTFVPVTRSACDLTDQNAVRELFSRTPVDSVVHAAAVVGGIQANINEPERFLAANIRINENIISAALASDVRNLVFLGSSCMYPRDYTNPLKEEYLLNAPLEPTNEGYALAKIVGAKHCEYISQQYGLAYRTIIPCNLYGPCDDFSVVSAHLVAAAVRKIVEAKSLGQQAVEIWGDGTARREFLYVDDLADFILDHLPRVVELPNYLNIGTGRDYSVKDYYLEIGSLVGFTGSYSFDTSKPVGMKQKLLDIGRASELGWRAPTDLRTGLSKTVDWYIGSTRT